MHGPRIKVMRTYNNKMDKNDLFSVSISENPKIVAGDQGDIKNSDLKKIFSFIKDNYKTLMKLWNEEYDDMQDFVKDLIKYKDI